MPPRPPTTTDPLVLMTTEQVATMFHVDPRTVGNWSANGSLPAFRVKGSRQIRYRRADVLALLERVPTVAPTTAGRPGDAATSTAAPSVPTQADRIGPSA